MIFLKLTMKAETGTRGRLDGTPGDRHIYPLIRKSTLGGPGEEVCLAMPKLSDPLVIRSKQIKNRIVMPPLRRQHQGLPLVRRPHAVPGQAIGPILLPKENAESNEQYSVQGSMTVSSEVKGGFTCEKTDAY
jgi:hypothetical protein